MNQESEIKNLGLSVFFLFFLVVSPAVLSAGQFVNKRLLAPTVIFF
jgi:hypothetical protein